MVKKATKTKQPDAGEIQREQKKRALESAIKQLEKDFGSGTVMRLGESNAGDVPVIPTGILELDLALGVGGLPKGRIVEIYGPESTGKTTVALQVVAEVQKNGGMAAFIDAEHALDPFYAKELGVDVDNLYVAQPSSGEEALEIAEALGRSGALDLIVVDSVAALVPRAEIDGMMGEAHVGLQARLMSQAMRKLAPAMNRTGTTLIFINQLRMKVGVIYGSPEVTAGGNALKYYASVRLDVRKGEPIKKGDQQIGSRTKIKVSKNKVAPPLKVAVADMYYGHGMDPTASLINVGSELEVFKKSGTWFFYGDTKLGQGRDNARNFLLENPEIAEEIKGKIYEKIRELNAPASKEEEPEEPEQEPAAVNDAAADVDIVDEEVDITPLEAAAALE